MRGRTLIRYFLAGALGVFGAVVIVALALNRPRSPAPPLPVKLNVNVLCDIEFDLSERMWEQAQYQLQTWQLAGTKDDSRVWLHVFSQRGAERVLPPDCALPESLESESTPNGVPLTYHVTQCAGSQPNAWGIPSNPHRLYASLDARFVTLRLVVAGTDRAQVLAQQNSLRAVARTLKLDACRDLTWAR